LKVGARQLRSDADFAPAVLELPIGQPCILVVRGIEFVRGRSVWQTRRVTVTPVTRRDYYSNSILKKEDEIKGLTYYHHRGEPAINSNDLHVYVIQKSEDTPPWLRLRIQYLGDSWLFISKYTLHARDTNLILNPDFNDVKRDNSARRIWEWYDIRVDDEILPMVYLLAEADDAKVRCHGSEYYSDRDISNNEKNRLKTVLAVYEMMGGKRPEPVEAK